MTSGFSAIGSIAIGSIDGVETYLTASESAFPDIRPGLAKQVVWADPLAKHRTPLAIVYIHGFSASKGEVRPLPDLVATALNANLFYTRLAGHGRSGDAMAEASVDDWQEDMREALDIAALLGDRTLIIATSTGAALATWALSQPTLTARVEGAVFLAPNPDQGPWCVPFDGTACPSERASHPWPPPFLRPDERPSCSLLDNGISSLLASAGRIAGRARSSATL
jgi:hypothetical protein